MKKVILTVSLFFCVASTQIWSQSTAKNKSNDPLNSMTVSESSSNDQLESNTEQRRPLTPEDYKLWSTSYISKISDNGNWYTYYVKNEHDPKLLLDSTAQQNFNFKFPRLVVGSTGRDISYSFPGGSYIDKFSAGGRWFGCLVPEKGMALLDLENGSIQWFSHTVKF